MSGFDHTHVRNPNLVRRIEVITGTGLRRKWDPDVKADIIMEAVAPGAVISQVARRHEVSPQELFGWLRDARKAAQASAAAFVPVVIEAAPAPEAPGPRPKLRRRRTGDGLIELEIDGVSVRVGRGAEAKTVAAVIRALKGAR